MKVDFESFLDIVDGLRDEHGEDVVTVCLSHSTFQFIANDLRRFLEAAGVGPRLHMDVVADDNVSINGVNVQSHVQVPDDIACLFVARTKEPLGVVKLKITAEN